MQSSNLTQELPTALGFLPAAACSFTLTFLLLLLHQSPSTVCLPTGSGAEMSGVGVEVRGWTSGLEAWPTGVTPLEMGGCYLPGIRNLRMAAAGPVEQARSQAQDCTTAHPRAPDAVPAAHPAEHICAERVGAACAENHVCGPGPGFRPGCRQGHTPTIPVQPCGRSHCLPLCRTQGGQNAVTRRLCSGV